MTSNNTAQKSWREAIKAVLLEADRPLHYDEIAKIIDQKKMRTSMGATPHLTVSAELGKMLKDKERVGRSIIRKPRPGYWARQEVADVPLEQEEDEEDENARSALKAYGLLWSRNAVNWSSAIGELNGTQRAGGQCVDFADQDGIYLLHSGSEIVYVGKTYTPNSRLGLYGRLRSHHLDPRKAGRWDSFSWFGFKAVTVSGELLDAPEGIPASVAIETIEAILIEGLLPRLNMRSGENIRKARDTILFFQVDREAA